VDKRGGTSDLSPEPRMLTKSVSDDGIVFYSEKPFGTTVWNNCARSVGTL
jgi:hypothetical protein